MDFKFDNYDLVLDVNHSRDCIYETADKVREVLGKVDSVLILERESFDVMMTSLSDLFSLEKTVQFNLVDFPYKKTVDAIKIQTKEGLPIVVVSEMLTYQSNVPFQTALLPMRILILGLEAKHFLSCPHIWSFKWEKTTEDLAVGDLFVVKDHANMSAQPPGIGPNIDEYGPRFYDISTMYEKAFTADMLKTLE